MVGPGMVALNGPGAWRARKPVSVPVSRRFSFSRSLAETCGIGSSELASSAPGPLQNRRTSGAWPRGTSPSAAS